MLLHRLIAGRRQGILQGAHFLFRVFGAHLDGYEATRRFVQYHLGCHSREVFCCLFLDSQHRVLRCEDLFFGTLDGAAVYPREVAVRALQNRAAALIFAHNHPSGVAEPSPADGQLKVTKFFIELTEIIRSCQRLALDAC